MSASTTSPSNHLAVNNLKPLMEALVDQHFRRYKRSFALSFTWEDDNTMAHKDVENFQGILSVLGLTPAEECIFSKDEKAPGWLAQSKIQSIVYKEMNSKDRVLLVVHYAGHGFERDNVLYFTDAHGRKMALWDRDFLYNVDSGSPIEETSNLDVVFILDSCFSYLGTRQYTPATRVAQVLAAAAADKDTRTPLSAVETASFTGKLLNELKFRKQAGEESVDLSELISCLRETSPQPVHGILVGNHSLRLAFPGHVAGTSIIPREPATKVAFSLRLSNSLSSDYISNFRKWITDIPKDIGLSLDAVYGNETGSMCLIFQAPWRLWAILVGYSFVSEIFENKPPINIVLTPARLPGTEEHGSSSKP